MWMGDRLGTPGAADKNQSWALLREHVSQADRRQTLSMHTDSGKVWTVVRTACWWLLQSSHPECLPLKWAPPCGAMKMAKSYKEGTAANQRRSGSEGHRFKTCRQQRLITVESLLKCTLPLVICIHNINSCVHQRNLVLYIFGLHVRDVTWAQ